MRRNGDMAVALCVPDPALPPTSATTTSGHRTPTGSSSRGGTGWQRRRWEEESSGGRLTGLRPGRHCCLLRPAAGERETRSETRSGSGSHQTLTLTTAAKSVSLLPPIRSFHLGEMTSSLPTKTRGGEKKQETAFYLSPAPE